MTPSPTPSAVRTLSIDPTLLETHAILRGTPAWKEVQASRERILQLREQDPPQPYPEMEADRDNVLRYADTLGRSADAVLFGVGVAAHLARCSNSQTLAQRLEDGFRALSTGLDLRSLDEIETRAELDRCFRAVLPQFNIDLPSLRSGAAGSPFPEKWREALQNVLNQMQDLPSWYRTSGEQAAWTNWQARLRAFAVNQTEIPPDIDYLRCRAAGLSAGSILRGRLKNLTLAEWSDAYLGGMTPQTPSRPLWFSIGALLGLGFDAGPPLKAILDSGIDSELKAASDFLASIPIASPITRKGVIIIRTTADSMTALWRVSGIPAITITYEDFIRASKIDLKSYFQPRLHGILIEGERAEQPDATLKRVDAKQITARFPLVRLGLLMARPVQDPSTVPPSYGLAIAPNDLINALSQSFQVTS
jgi:hypothetical protein